jgi:hypothetical protein
MIVWDFILILLIAFVLSAIVVGPARWRRAEEGAAWPALIFLFAIFFFGLWAADIWLTPAGPVAWGTSWFALLVVGIILALIVTAAAPPRRRPPPGSAEMPGAAEAAVLVGFGTVFWILLLVLIGAIVAGYVWI